MKVGLKWKWPNDVKTSEMNIYDDVYLWQTMWNHAGLLSLRTKTHSDEMEGKWLQRRKFVRLARQDRRMILVCEGLYKDMQEKTKNGKNSVANFLAGNEID